ncbi:MAG: hypothetical protein ABSH48_17630 [Verrucomicrobiota bacterium]|jgi:hypothetical protein
MGWIKRNLLFVVVGLVALGALGAAGFYIYSSFSSNADESQKLSGIYATLNDLNNQQPQPGNDKINNTETAKAQQQQLRDWINQAAARFHTIAPIPTGEVTSKTFATALGTTVYELTQEAKDNSVSLPPQYYFSFQVQNSLLNISSGLGPLAQQLGEVRAITEIMFAAGVNNLDSIQRVRVSEDDVAKGLEADYTDKTPVTNSLASITPYVVTFRCFTPELAKVIAGFANSTNPFIIKSVAVQQASTEAAALSMAGAPPAPAPPSAYGYQQRYSNRYGLNAPAMPPPRPPTQPSPGTMSSKGGLQTVIKQQLLRVTLEVDVVKLLLKS